MKDEIRKTHEIAVSDVIDIAGDSIWAEGEAITQVYVSRVVVEYVEGTHEWEDEDPDTGTIESGSWDYDWAKVKVYGDFDWKTVYTDKGFDAAISKLVGFKVSGSEAGMQDDGVADMDVRSLPEADGTTPHYDAAKRLVGVI